MQTLYCMMFVVSAVLFLLAALNTSWNARGRAVNLQAAGLFVFALVFVFQAFNRIT